MESRMDRIERELELFMQGMKELRESQKKTDEIIQQTHLELRESQKKTDEQILELKESQKKTDEIIQQTHLELRESQKKTDEQIRKTSEKLDRIGKQLADQGLVQGEVAEELFYRNLSNLFGKKELLFSDIQRNVKKKGIAEYDIVAKNKGNVLVIEVKNKLEKRMIDDFINRKIPVFKTLFPEYRDCRLLAGMGALVVKDEVGRYAEKAGLYVLTQSTDGGAALMNRKDFKPKEFL